MKTLFIVLFTLAVCSAHSLLAQQQTQVLIPKDYGATGAIAINGKRVPANKVLDELMTLANREGSNVPIAVVLPDSSRFTDWNNVRGLLWKVGFINIRYFVKWSSTEKMVELKQVGEAIDKLPGE